VRGVGDRRLHLPHLLSRNAILLSKMLGRWHDEILGRVRLQLERAVNYLYFAWVRVGSQGVLQAAADVAPRANDVAPYLD